MPDPAAPLSNAELARRLDALERRVARWRRTAVATAAAGGIAAAALLAGGAAADRSNAARAPVDEIQVRRLAVVDERGATRILLTSEGQDAFIGMTDAQGATRAMLQAHPAGARLVMGDGRPRLVLAADPTAVVATMSGPDGIARAIFGIGATGRETLVLTRPDGSASATLP